MMPEKDEQRGRPGIFGHGVNIPPDDLLFEIPRPRPGSDDG